MLGLWPANCQCFNQEDWTIAARSCPSKAQVEVAELLWPKCCHFWINKTWPTANNSLLEPYNLTLLPSDYGIAITDHYLHPWGRGGGHALIFHQGSTEASLLQGLTKPRPTEDLPPGPPGQQEESFLSALSERKDLLSVQNEWFLPRGEQWEAESQRF